MSKIKIIYYSHEVDYAGTWRAHEAIVESINKNIFDPYVMYWDECPNNPRLEDVRKMIGSDHVISFKRSKEKTGPEKGYTPLWTDFHEVAKSIQPDIIHFARSGYLEWPFNTRLAPLQVETNIFSGMDTSGYLDKSIAISKRVADIRKASDAIIYYPVKEVKLIGSTFREQYNIPKDAIVCGRIGRPSTTSFCPYGIEAFKTVQEKYKNVYYIIVAPCDEIKRLSKDIPNVILLDPTSNDEIISKFFRSLDIFLHYRLDGETFGLAIAQAMIYGIPIVSHISIYNNAHVETVGDGGYVAPTYGEYVDYLSMLITNPDERKKVGNKGRNIVLEKYEQEKIIRQFEDCYIRWLHPFI